MQCKAIELLEVMLEETSKSSKNIVLDVSKNLKVDFIRMRMVDWYNICEVSYYLLNIVELMSRVDIFVIFLANFANFVHCPCATYNIIVCILINTIHMLNIMINKTVSFFLLKL